MDKIKEKLTKAGVEVKDGKIRKSDVEKASKVIEADTAEQELKKVLKWKSKGGSTSTNVWLGDSYHVSVVIDKDLGVFFEIDSDGRHMNKDFSDRDFDSMEKAKEFVVQELAKRSRKHGKPYIDDKKPLY